MNTCTQQEVNEKPHAGLKLYRPCKVGKTVRIKRGFKAGQLAVIHEKLDDMITGMSRYGLRFQSDPNNNTHDYCRFEFTPIKN
jgi:hypothetical protein